MNTQNFARMRHIKNIHNGQESVDRIKDQVKKHPWYLQYHVSPQANWMNDPTGFSFFNNEYHLFYQHYPYDHTWGLMHWAHVKSKDLVHWEHMPIALTPSESYDADGCFSGSAIEINNKLLLMYTGHVITGTNSDDDLIETQAIAISSDGAVFEKIDENPVIKSLPEGDFHQGHFRDPKIWKNENTYYAIIGSTTKDKTKGQAVLFKSINLTEWAFVTTVAKAGNNQGTMWECPDLFELNKKYILIISPQGICPEGMYYHNHHQSGFFIGDFDYDDGRLKNYNEFQLLDYGFDFYAPQTVYDKYGRRILIGWMNMWESEMPTKKFGWAGAMTIPRLLELKEGSLKIRPIPEMRILRKNEVIYKDIIVKEALSLPKVVGDCIELEIELDLKDALRFAIKMRVNDVDDEETVFSYDVIKGLISLDRNRSGEGVKGIRSAEHKIKDHKMKLNIFMDKSSIEIFIDEGEKVMTTRIFPKNISKGILFLAEGKARIISICKWDLSI
jgi:beta-fructofuranosidase